MRALNATDLFEGRYDGRSWPASSESFWTGLFALFALHLGKEATPPPGRLTVWHCTDGSSGKWYAPRIVRPTLELSNVSFDAIATEVRALTKPWPSTDLPLPAAAGGFSPDVVIQSRLAGGAEHFIVIENKITSSACLADNQLENYPRLIQWLIEHKVNFDFLFLQSVGCCSALAQQARSFQNERWGSNFGILLWEEVLREMHRTHFAPDLPIVAWQKYSAALESDCVRPGASR